MARRVESHWNGGLHRFRLLDGLEPESLASVTEVELVRGSEVLTSATPTAGDVRWGSPYPANEIVANLPASFIAETGLVEVTITSPTYPAGVTWGSVDIGTGGFFVAAAGVFREQCDVCHLWFPVEDLVRQLQIRLVAAGTNYLPYSRFNPVHWECSADYLGEASMGFPRWVHAIDPGDGPTRIVNGAASFWGDGAMTAIAPVDLSAWSYALLQADVGINEVFNGVLSVAFGLIYDPGGIDELFYPVATRSNVNTATVWGVIDIVDIDAGHRAELYPEFRVTTPTGQEVWWIERLGLAKDAQTPSMVTVETKGAPVIRLSDGRVLGKTVVCPKHWEPLAKQINEYTPDFESVPVVEDEEQEL